MKILHLIPHFLPSAHFGGTPVVCHQLAKNQSKLKHQVTIITTDVYSNSERTKASLTNENSISGYKVIRFKNISNSLAYRFKFSTPIGLFSYLLKNLNKFDVIHLHEYRSTLNIIASLALLFLSGKKPKIVIQPHGTYENYNTRKYLKFIFDLFFKKLINLNVNLYLALSENEKKVFLSHNIKSKNIQILPNGVEICNQITNKNNPPNTKLPSKYILYLGRLDKRKGIDLLIKAYSKSKMPKNNVKLLLVGNDDGYRKYCQKLAKDLKLNDKVIFKNPVSGSKKWQLLRQAQLLSYVTKNEFFGLVPLEAAISGCWSIVASSAGVAPIIKKYRLGDVINYGNQQAFIKLLNLYVNKKPGINKDKVKNLQQNFNWLTISKKSILLYKTI